MYPSMHLGGRVGGGQGHTTSASSTNPTGMHSCLTIFFFYGFEPSLKSITRSTIAKKLFIPSVKDQIKNSPCSLNSLVWLFPYMVYF